MEAVPRLPMLSFALKLSPEGTSFVGLKKYIAECYQENPESYSKEVYSLETLRNCAMRPAKDVTGCSTLKRYYCQLHSLANRFPNLSEKNLFTFTWKDLYSNNITETNDIRYEMSAVLFNIAAIHTQLGASVNRSDVDGMKLACTHFQCAAWAFGELKDKFSNINNGNDYMTPELLLFMQQVSFAQAQECILEKSLIDNRKPAVVAKVTSQIINYYSAALVALLTGGDDGSVSEVVGNNVYKEWKKYARFKISYLNCILLLYQGQQAEEQQKMGERVVLYQTAWDKLEEARKESKGMSEFQKEIAETLTFTADVVEAKRKAAKNENEFIYHEPVPNISDIPAVQGANLVNGISFSVTDPDVAGEDIFARLVPMKAHEASSLYSEEKAQLLRKIGAKIEEKDNELNTYMSSLNLEHLNISEERSNKIPQGIVDRCASLNAKTNAIPDLVASMSNLAEICADVETNLNEIKELLSEEEKNEKQYQQKSGVRRSNAHFTELSREFQKYMEAHQKAGESNATLRRAMELHVNNLRILSRPLQDIQSSVPKLSGEVNENVFHELKLLLNKVNEMKAQRAQFHADLRIAINDDDITSKVIALGDGKNLKELFKKEIAKHDKICALIEQNLVAQGNILSALTEMYAKCAPLLKTVADVKHKKENFFSSLAASYDVYEDLLAKSAKGLEFYKKLQGNVQKLLARVRAARDVQDEERQQRLKSSKTSNNDIRPSTSSSNVVTGANPSAPKLKDFLKSNKLTSGSDTAYIPPIRPNPLGSEAPTTSSCINTPISSYYTTQSFSHTGIEPTVPYVMSTTSVNLGTGGQTTYPSDVNGYINPIYQNTQNTNLTSSYVPHGSQNYNQSPQMYQPQPSSLYQSSTNLPITDQTTTNLQSKYSQNQTSTQQYQYPTSNSTVQYSQNVEANNQPSQYYSYSQPSTYPTQQQYDVQQQQSAQYNQSISSAPAGYTQQSTPLGYSTQTPASTKNISQYNQNQQTQGAVTPQQTQGTVTPQQTQPTAYTSSISQPSTDLSSGVISHTKYQQSSLDATTAGVLNQPAQPLTTTAYTLQGQSQGSSDQNTASWNVTGLSTQMENLNIQANQQGYGYYSMQQQTSYPNQLPSEQITNQSLNYSIPATSMEVNPSIYGIQTSSFPSHPGYVFNQQTGEYQYASGYQVDPNVQPLMCGQYTNAAAIQNSNTTDSTNQSIVGQTFVNQYSVPSSQPSVSEQQSTNVSYYNIPYGYQSNITPFSQANINIPPVNTQQVTADVGANTLGNSTYIQSNSYNGTNTTISANYADPVVTTTHQQQQQQQQQQPQQPQQNLNQNLQTSQQQQTKSTANTKNVTTKKSTTGTKKSSSNVDLLSGIDFSSPTSLPAPALQPQPAATPLKSDTPTSSSSSIPQQQQETPKLQAESTTKHVRASSISSEPPNKSALETIFQTTSDLNDQRKLSCDNLSICSDLSSLDQNFDWDSVSVQSGGAGDKNQQSPSKQKSSDMILKLNKDPFDDPKVLKYFHKEVERYERMIESLNIKMLNGNTPLTTKWNELQDLLTKDETKRTTIVGKLFPEKNRSSDCIPYDHARVILERTTDDYINAAYVKDLGSGCPIFILTQTPLQNTLNDFWFMVWSQKARTLVCLHTPNEILDTFWPTQIGQEMHFDDFSVALIKQVDLSHCIEYHLKLTMNGADAILDLSLIQIKAWTKTSPSQILGVTQNILDVYKEKCIEFKSNTTLIMNCLTGSERSGLIAVAICAILAMKTRRPVLINVIDVWFRICSQRKNALKDVNNLQLSMQIVLCHAHDLLNKRGILTSYQMKNAQIAASKEKEETKDPLNDLDPLWKLK